MMAKRIFVFVLMLHGLFLLLISCNIKISNDKSGVFNDTIELIPLVDDGPYIFITVQAKINDNIVGDFILDTGGTDQVAMDSTLFYTQMDTSKLTRVQTKPNQFKKYWRANYVGEIPIEIGSHRFIVNSVEVLNQKNRYRGDFFHDGYIGVNPFLNKITIVDFDNNTISFVDTISVDSTYTAIHLGKSKTYSPGHPNVNHRFVEIEGFVNKKGESQNGYLLFDTGDNSGFLFKRSYVEKLSVEDVEYLGDQVRWRVDSLQIGPIYINNVPLRMVWRGPDRYEGLLGGDGVMGMALIRRFNFIFDHKNYMLYLKPAKVFEEKNKPTQNINKHNNS